MSPKKQLVLAVLSTLAFGLPVHAHADDDDAHHARAKHVLLISVDGLHQTAPTILSELGLKPHELQAVQIEGTKRLPHLH